MGYQMRDSSGAHQDLPHFAQFVLGLLRCDMTNSKATVGVIDLTEILSGLVNADDIHKTSGAGYLRWDLAINLNKPLPADLLYFISC